MTEHAHRILTSGRYQVMALTRDPDFDPPQIIGYVVTTSAGEWLRHEASLEQAAQWMQLRLEEDDAVQIDAGDRKILGPSRLRPRRLRR